jgi:hypothetical protein
MRTAGVTVDGARVEAKAGDPGQVIVGLVVGMAAAWISGRFSQQRDGKE